jgi:tetratricopeptide (TPR) repeat protein
MRHKLILALVILFIFQSLQAQKATITLEKKDILTYPYDDPDPVPALAEGKDQMYPYYSFNGYSLNGRMQKWDVVKLENDYIIVWILPAAGGKVWGAVEKSTGEEFIYRNEVMKFRNISMRGPWTSGGIEFNFGIIGHSPSTCVPVDYRMAENEDGSVSCIVGNTDLPSGTKWNVEIKLQKDKAYFETNATWINPTALPQTYYVWMTAAAVVSDDLEFFYPGNAQIGHGGEYGLWPVNKEGRNVSWYKDNNFGSSKSYHVVGEYNDFMGGYYHKKDFGFGHWALYDEMPGHKLWLWSLARDGGIWEDLLTDTDGQYMEFQAGRMFNQYGGTSAFRTPITQTPFPPDLTDSWHEIWFPVKGTGGISDVSPSGAMHVQDENGKLKIAINAFATVSGRIQVRTGEIYVFDEQRNFKPMQVYDTVIDLRGHREYEVTVGGMDLQYSPSSKKYIDRPFESSVDTKPETASTWYQQGMQLKDMRKYAEAKAMFKKCLETDHLYVDAYAALAELCYRSMDYDSVFACTEAAIQLDTYHPAANYLAGITYLAYGDFTNALESLGWAARSPEFRSAAYEKMAVAEFRLNDLNLSEHYANASLDYNRKNLSSLQLLAIIKSRTGRTKEAEECLRSVENLDRTGHFSCYECHKLNPSEANIKRFTSSIDGEMPYQSYLDLSMYYNSLDLKEDALDVIQMAPENPLVSIWRAYLKEDREMLEQAAGMAPAFVFPHRTETVQALEWAAENNNSWKFRYYLALNYAAISRMADCRRLFTECGQEPDYAPFYLARAAIVNDEKQVLPDLMKARQLAPSDWRTAVRLTGYYRSHGDHAAELKIASDAYSKSSNNSTLGIEYAVSLINNSQFAKSLKMLEGMKILPNEGSSEGKRVFTQAALMLSMDLIDAARYADALKMIDKSAEWPENLGVGKPFEPDTRIQDYLRSYCLKKLNRKDQSDPAYIEKIRTELEKSNSEMVKRALKMVR